MIIPVRCFNCGKVLGNKWILYKKLVKDEKMSEKEALEFLGLNKYCSTSIFLTHVDTIDQLLKYDRYNHILPPHMHYYK